jgi:hypothetical protein
MSTSDIHVRDISYICTCTYCTLNTVAASFLIMFCCILSSGALNVDRLHLSRLFPIDFLQYCMWEKLVHLHKGTMSRWMCVKDGDTVDPDLSIAD